jgi:hypothetical protein
MLELRYREVESTLNRATEQGRGRTWDVGALPPPPPPILDMAATESFTAYEEEWFSIKAGVISKLDKDCVVQQGG